MAAEQRKVEAGSAASAAAVTAASPEKEGADEEDEELEDDVHDHWSSRPHLAERMRLIAVLALLAGFAGSSSSSRDLKVSRTQHSSRYTGSASGSKG